MKGKISPSMMCAGLLNLGDYLKSFEKAGIEYLHIDVMDGHFVSNFTLGTDYVKKLRRITSIPLDLHFMIERPEDKMDWFDIQPGEYVAVHYESTPHIQRALGKIKEKDARPMLAVNPGTPLDVVKYLADDLDGVLIMTVNPGFAGQKLVPQTLDKIAELRKWLDANGYEKVEIEVDGNVSFENAARMREAGADIFVAGTSSVFNDDYDTEELINKLREAIK